MIIKISKKNIIVVLMIVILIMGCLIWYGELGTNREVPKKAKFVSNFLLENDRYG
ncbi:MAG: hypothetical protein GX987_04560 [Tissierellia bacterium]|nr:hypothetical protein [Tissierellia bacterium]